MQRVILEIFFLSYVATQAAAIFFLALHRRRARHFDATRKIPANYPSLSIVTSLKGPTPQMGESLRSLLNQNYPAPLEFVIATKDAQEPLLSEARELFREFPHVAVQWIHPVDVESRNPRTAKIARACAAATHPWIFTTCVDTRFDPHFLRRTVELTEGRDDVFVSGYPVIDHPRDLGAKLEAVGLNLDVMQFFIFSSLSRRRPIGYGGAILASRRLLTQVGGFDSVVKLLTDDVTIARRFIQAGATARLAPNPGYVRQDRHTLASFWNRQVRWKMIGKYFLPELFFLSPLSWVPQAFLPLGVALGDTHLLAMGLAALGVRVTAAFLNQMLLGTPPRDWLQAWAIVPYDFAAVINTVQALFSRRVRWGPTVMTLDSKGSVCATRSV